MNIFPELESEVAMKRQAQKFRREIQALESGEEHAKGSVAGVCLGLIALAAGLILVFGAVIS